MPDRPLYEIDVEPDDGWTLPEGRRWRGYRVRYRELGARRWSRFLLVDLDEPPSIAELQAVAHAHATGEGVQVIGG